MTPVFLFPTSGTEWRNWLGDEGAAILAILIVLFVVWVLIRAIALRILKRIVRRAAEIHHQDPDLARRRTDTLVSAINWGIAVILIFVGGVIILGELGLNVSALIASAGIAGLALTLGAQAFVKDLINGTFILAENQYGVGDVVTVAGVSGEVLDLNPRRTVLRDGDGNVHTIPNGAISVATNMTRDFSRINLNIGVAYEEDIDRVITVINDECEKLRQERSGDFLSEVKVLRIDALADWSVNLKITADVRAGMQWDLTGALRLRLKNRFDREGIEMPYPHQTIVEKLEDAGQGSGSARPGGR